MDKQEFASKFDVGFADVEKDGIVVVIVRLYAILTAALDRVKAARSTITVGVKKAVEAVSKNTETVEAADSLANQVRELLFTAIQGNPDLSVLLPDHLDEIKDEVREVRSLVMQGLNIEDEEEVDTSEDYEVASLANETLRNFVTLLGMQGHSMSDLPDTMTRKNKNNELVLSLPKIHGGKDKDESNGAGRPVAGGKFKFTLNGKIVPVSGFDRLAVFYCSTVTDRINGTDLKASIKRQTGKEWSDKGNETFTVKVPAGTLTATLESK